VACIGAMVIISFLTREPTYEKINGLTYGTTVVEDKKASRESWNTRDVVLSLVVIIIIALVMIYFSPLIIAK
jgi:SSS family solute:Na+ symporter